jgi:uncharacterized protein (TIGR02246 family)
MSVRAHFSCFAAPLEENSRSRHPGAPAIANVRASLLPCKKNLMTSGPRVRISGVDRPISFRPMISRKESSRNETPLNRVSLSTHGYDPPSQCQTKADEEAARKLPQAFSDAWAKHDGHELAKLMADDADFVTVATTYLHGRSDFEKFHVRLLSGRFKDSTLTPLQTTVRFLHPDMAVVHWSWKVEGDKNPDGTPRPPRYGMMTLVAEKRSGDWLVVVGQNTNAILGIPPELQDIKTPIAIPGTAPDPQ